MPNGEATAQELAQQHELALARQQETARAQPRQAPAAQQALPGGDIAEKMTEFVKKFPIIGPLFGMFQKQFPVWVWTLINSAKAFAIFLLVLLSTPLWWAPLVGIVLVSNRIKLPFLPKLPQPGPYEPVAAVLALTAVLLVAVAAVLFMLCATPQGAVTQGFIKAGATVGIEAAEAALPVVKLCGNITS